VHNWQMTNLTQRFAIGVLVLAWAHVAAAQTADEVIEKSIAAMGGRAAHDKIKTRVMTGELSLGTPAGEIAGTVELYAAVPNKQRSVIKADLSTLGAGQLLIDQRFDGTTAYAIDSMQGNREITGSQLENMKAQSFPHPFLNYKASGMSVKLGAREKVGERDAYLLTFEPTTGPPIRTYVDVETFMPIRTIIRAEVPQVGQIEQMIDPSDFRDVDGVKVPFKLRLTNSMQTITMTFSKVENNVTLDEKMFVKP
jgi:zinc protease